MNPESFVFDARYAAITLLKARNYESPIIDQVDLEYKNLTKVKQKNKEDIKEQDKRLIRRIRQIGIKSVIKYRLKNGNELQVKRLTEDYFQVRIEAYRSEMAPVIICKVKDASTYFCYPFLYLKSILIFGIGGTMLMTILAVLGYIQNDIFVFLLPLLVTVGFQLVMMPFMYFVILNFFKKRLRKK